MTIKPGDYVAVDVFCDGNYIPGKVTCVSQGIVTVTVVNIDVNTGKWGVIEQCTPDCYIRDFDSVSYNVGTYNQYLTTNIVKYWKNEVRRVDILFWCAVGALLLDVLSRYV